VVAHTGLRERGFGVFEGKTFTEIDMAWPADALAWRKRVPDWAPGGGESLLQLRERILQTARRWQRQHMGEQIVLVAHGGVLDVLYRIATGQDLQAPRTWQLGNASINRLLWTPEGFSRWWAGPIPATWSRKPAMKPTLSPEDARKEAVPAALRALVGKPVDAIDTPPWWWTWTRCSATWRAWPTFEEAQHPLAPARQDAQERGHGAAADAGWCRGRVRAENRRGRGHGGWRCDRRLHQQ
jgi:broad specificity phosphatase PhoE